MSGALGVSALVHVRKEPGTDLERVLFMSHVVDQILTRDPVVSYIIIIN